MRHCIAVILLQQPLLLLQICALGHNTKVLAGLAKWTNLEQQQQQQHSSSCSRMAAKGRRVCEDYGAAARCSGTSRAPPRACAS